jgi:FkbM family methyltransferase
MIKRGLRYLLNILGTGDGRDRVEEVYNWDNCDPHTNGEFFFIKKNAAFWDVCLDIGANVGEYASKILEYNPSCRIVCFDPNDTLNDVLKEKGIKEVHNFVVGDTTEPVTININIDDSTQSSIHRKNDSSLPRVVNGITIDNFVENQNIEKISFLKIDTEGHELAVLMGARRTLWDTKIDMIQFEYGGTYIEAGTTLKEIYDLIGDNYILCHLFPGGILPVKYSKEIETYRYSNWVALSRKLFSDCD